MGNYEYKGYKIVFPKNGSIVYAYKSGKFVCSAHDEPTIESMIDALLET